MRPHIDRCNVLGALQRNPRIDDVGGEYVTLQQEVMIPLERRHRLFERARHGLDALLPLIVQLVQVLIDRRRWLELALDAIQSGHEQSGEREIRVRGWIRSPELNPASLRAARVTWNPADGRAVPRRI